MEDAIRKCSDTGKSTFSINSEFFELNVVDYHIESATNSFTRYVHVLVDNWLFYLYHGNRASYFIVFDLDTGKHYIGQLPSRYTALGYCSFNPVKTIMIARLYCFDRARDVVLDISDILSWQNSIEQARDIRIIDTQNVHDFFFGDSKILNTKYRPRERYSDFWNQCCINFFNNMVQWVSDYQVLIEMHEYSNYTRNDGFNAKFADENCVFEYPSIERVYIGFNESREICSVIVETL